VNIRLRRLAAADLEAAHGLSTEAGWPHRLEDWRLFHEFGSGIAACDETGAIIGTAMGWRYGARAGTLGMILVSPPLQGQGLGRRLMQNLLDDAGGRGLMLNATAAGLHLYTACGFGIVGAIRQFQGRSSLSTYLTVVIQRFYLDFLIGQRGKWRPSAKAKRLGRVAILLERLTRRDGWTFAEAVACLQTNYGVEATWEELYDLSTTLPHGHLRRQTMPEHHAWQVASPDPEPDVRILHAEQRVKARRTRSALKHAVTALTGEERVLLRLRFCQGLSVAKMARMLNVDQRKLYGIFDRLFHRLRLSLEAGGVSASDVEPPAVT